MKAGTACPMKGFGRKKTSLVVIALSVDVKVDKIKEHNYFFKMSSVPKLVKRIHQIK